MTITQEVLEQSCLGLISYSGAAKSDYLEAVECAKSGDFEQAEAAIERGNENYLHAHEAHFGLLQEETGTEGGLLTRLLLFMLRISCNGRNGPNHGRRTNRSLQKNQLSRRTFLC